MRDETALEAALGLLRLPSRARLLRSGEVPADLEILLRVVAGDDLALSEAAATCDEPADVVKQAASFYVEQILLHPEADSYRVLGARSDTTTDQLRRNMALLLRWLHPDHEDNRARSLFASRVTQAWNDVKTGERRSAYDTTRSIETRVELDPRSAPPSAAHRRHGTVAARGAEHRIHRRSRSRKSIWRYLKHLMGRARD